MFIVPICSACSAYLLGCEARDQHGHVVPVDGLWNTPERAQHHVQDQQVVVIGKVLVQGAVTTHVCQQLRVRDVKVDSVI